MQNWNLYLNLNLISVCCCCCCCSMWLWWTLNNVITFVVVVVVVSLHWLDSIQFRKLARGIIRPIRFWSMKLHVHCGYKSHHYHYHYRVRFPYCVFVFVCMLFDTMHALALLLLWRIINDFDFDFDFRWARFCLHGKVPSNKGRIGGCIAQTWLIDALPNKARSAQTKTSRFKMYPVFELQWMRLQLSLAHNLAWDFCSFKTLVS